VENYIELMYLEDNNHIHIKYTKKIIILVRKHNYETNKDFKIRIKLINFLIDKNIDIKHIKKYNFLLFYYYYKKMKYKAIIPKILQFDELYNIEIL